MEKALKEKILPKRLAHFCKRLVILGGGAFVFGVSSMFALALGLDNTYVRFLVFLAVFGGAFLVALAGAIVQLAMIIANFRPNGFGGAYFANYRYIGILRAKQGLYHQLQSVMALLLYVALMLLSGVMVVTYLPNFVAVSLWFD